MKEKCSTRIKEALKIRNISYIELEKITGISKSAIQRYATGETKGIPAQKLEKLASALKVSHNYLLGVSESDNTKYSVDGYDNLNEDGKELVLNYIAMLNSNEKYCLSEEI